MAKQPACNPKGRVVQCLINLLLASTDEAVRAYASSEEGMAFLSSLVPGKWEAHGCHIVAKVADPQPALLGKGAPAGLQGLLSKRLIGRAMMEGLGAKVVVEDVGGVSGELRQPCDSIVLAKHASLAQHSDASPEVSEARHIENRIVYSFDVTRVMFSSGNTTERIYHGSITIPGERVVDMFSGIGYFTLPMLKAGASVAALEKNEISVGYLKKNAVLNKIPEQRLVTYTGDNREVGSAHLGTADRVSMGYFNGGDDAAPFIPRALEFLNMKDSVRRRPLIHYHYLSTREGRVSTVVQHFAKYAPHVMCVPSSHLPEGGGADGGAIDPPPQGPAVLRVCAALMASGGAGGAAMILQNPSLRGTIVAIRKVKSYRPQVFHYVADVAVERVFR